MCQQHRDQLLDQLVLADRHLAVQPRGDGLPDAADDEVRQHRQVALIVAAEPVVEMLGEQRNEHCRRLESSAYEYWVHLCAAVEELPNPSVGADCLYDGGNPRAYLQVRGGRGDLGFDGGRELLDCPVEDRGGVLVLVGEAFIEVALREAGMLANGAQGEIAGPIRGAENVQTHLKESLPAPGQALVGSEATVGAAGWCGHLPSLAGAGIAWERKAH